MQQHKNEYVNNNLKTTLCVSLCCFLVLRFFNSGEKMTGKTLLVLCLLWSKAASQVTTATGPRLLPDHKGMTQHCIVLILLQPYRKKRLNWTLLYRSCVEKKQEGGICKMWVYRKDKFLSGNSASS